MFVELASDPSATTCSVDERPAARFSPYRGGTVSAIHASPVSRYRSTARGSDTTSTSSKMPDPVKRLMRSWLAGLRSASAITIGTLRTSVVAA
jgi:hypothetical protein